MKRKVYVKKVALPLTYQPKIRGVMEGTIRQTIRGGRKYHENDHIEFFTWSGKPYRSQWGERSPVFELKEVIPVILNYSRLTVGGNSYSWDSWYADNLARLDGIDPPTGPALWEVLYGYSRVKSLFRTDEGAEYQILRW